jgi:hypothetical protein
MKSKGVRNCSNELREAVGIIEERICQQVMLKEVRDLKVNRDEEAIPEARLLPLEPIWRSGMSFRSGRLS